ncbi:hypothetical protein [Halomonas sp. MCCC 1A11062]|uniref:hypothetical protein n=1 Tax=Halomonas sp. MCCC 1A11062 TaxID=2733485 RepID=UPI001F261B9A|nr:hypothetical protein [Halomonas sp. MCCC 1A11062]MCE8039278.1 hypothetical protein [Halomonas sp. MCCC 1A11062]
MNQNDKTIFNEINNHINNEDYESVYSLLLQAAKLKTNRVSSNIDDNQSLEESDRISEIARIFYIQSKSEYLQEKRKSYKARESLELKIERSYRKIVSEVAWFFGFFEKIENITEFKKNKMERQIRPFVRMNKVVSQDPYDNFDYYTKEAYENIVSCIRYTYELGRRFNNYFQARQIKKGYLHQYYMLLDQHKKEFRSRAEGVKKLQESIARDIDKLNSLPAYIFVSVPDETKIMDELHGLLKEMCLEEVLAE